MKTRNNSIPLICPLSPLHRRRQNSCFGPADVIYVYAVDSHGKRSEILLRQAQCYFANDPTRARGELLAISYLDGYALGA
jgi:hypothetical protein